MAAGLRDKIRELREQAKHEETKKVLDLLEELFGRYINHAHTYRTSGGTFTTGRAETKSAWDKISTDHPHFV